METLGRHYGESRKGPGRDCGETGERLELNIVRQGEKWQYEEPWGQEYSMETGGKMDFTDT